MKRILVVTVAGRDEQWLVDPAAELAAEIGATVTVLAVDDVESQRFAVLPREELLRSALATAERLAERIAAHGVTATAAARSGAAIDAALAYAGEIGADLIVVGAPRRRPVVDRLIGNLAVDLVRRSDRQVLAVTQPD